MDIFRTASSEKRKEKLDWWEPDFQVCGWLRDQIRESSVNKGQLLECRVLSDIFTLSFFSDGPLSNQFILSLFL
jgi:hypothetical protein